MQSHQAFAIFANIATVSLCGAAIAKILAFSCAIAMAKFATAADALTAQLAAVDAKLTNIEIGTDPELYFELSYKRAVIQQSIAASGGGGSSAIATNTSISYNAGASDAKTQRVAIATDANSIAIGGTLPAFATIPTVTANAGTNLNTSALALETGGNLAAILAKLPSTLGAKTAANALAVTLSTDGVASGIAAQIGEVQASPTTNTVLDRLKSIATALAYGIKTAANSFSIGLAQDQGTETQLIAPSSTAARSMAGYSKAFIQVVVASINTNVTLRIEGSNDNTNWTNLSSLNSDTIITANGVYGFSFVGCPQYIRTTFVSETGGTAATVDVVTRVSA